MASGLNSLSEIKKKKKEINSKLKTGCLPIVQNIASDPGSVYLDENYAHLVHFVHHHEEEALLPLVNSLFALNKVLTDNRDYYQSQVGILSNSSAQASKDFELVVQFTNLEQDYLESGLIPVLSQISKKMRYHDFWKENFRHFSSLLEFLEQDLKNFDDLTAHFVKGENRRAAGIGGKIISIGGLQVLNDSAIIDESSGASAINLHEAGIVIKEKEEKKKHGEDKELIALDFDIGVSHKEDTNFGSKSMEDAHYYPKENFAGRKGWVFAGVYDGHSNQRSRSSSFPPGRNRYGKIAASSAKSRIAEVFEKKILSFGTKSPSFANVKSAFEEAYKAASDDILRMNSVDSNMISGVHAANIFVSGTGLYVAHAGDCRVIVSIGSEVEFATKDHVIHDPQMGMIPSKCLGDFDPREESYENAWVPEVEYVNLAELLEKRILSPLYITLCSDGVIKSMHSSQESLNSEICHYIDSDKKAIEDAENLIKMAYGDDATVIIMKTYGKKWDKEENHGRVYITSPGNGEKISGRKIELKATLDIDYELEEYDYQWWASENGGKRHTLLISKFHTKGMSKKGRSWEVIDSVTAKSIGKGMHEIGFSIYFKPKNSLDAVKLEASPVLIEIIEEKGMFGDILKFSGSEKKELKKILEREIKKIEGLEIEVDLELSKPGYSEGLDELKKFLIPLMLFEIKSAIRITSDKNLSQELIERNIKEMEKLPRYNPPKDIWVEFSKDADTDKFVHSLVDYTSKWIKETHESIKIGSRVYLKIISPKDGEVLRMGSALYFELEIENLKKVIDSRGYNCSIFYRRSGSGSYSKGARSETHVRKFKIDIEVKEAGKYDFYASVSGSGVDVQSKKITLDILSEDDYINYERRQRSKKIGLFRDQTQALKKIIESVEREKMQFFGDKETSKYQVLVRQQVKSNGLMAEAMAGATLLVIEPKELSNFIKYHLNYPAASELWHKFVYNRRAEVMRIHLLGPLRMVNGESVLENDDDKPLNLDRSINILDFADELLKEIDIGILKVKETISFFEIDNNVKILK